MGQGISDPVSFGIPVLGNLASTLLQRHWALKDIEAQNKYNSPVEQVKRLRAAGLPLAAMFSGSGASQQSDLPRATNVDPTMGTAEGMSNYFQNRLQKQQLPLLQAQNDLLQAQIFKTREEGRNAAASADIQEGQRDWMKTVEPGFYQGTGTNQFRELNATRDLKNAQWWTEENRSKIQAVLGRISEATEETQKKSYIETLAKIFKTNKLLDQQFDLNQLETQINNALSSAGKMNWLPAILMKLFGNSGQGGYQLPFIK